MSNMADKDNKMSIRMTDEDLEIIERLSHKFGDISASAVIRMALRAYDRQVFRGRKTE